MPIQVKLRPLAEFTGPADLYSELLRRLSDGPCPLAELVEVDGCTAVILATMLDGLPRRGRILDLGAVVEIDSARTIGSRPL